MNDTPATGAAPAAATPPMRAYVLGFASSPDGLVLIRKRATAEWHAGKLNGVGGKIEASDANATEAMVREFFEETGTLTPRDAWEQFGTLLGERACVFLFRAPFLSSVPVTTTTDEEVSVVPLDEFWQRTDLAHNLRSLVALALDPELTQVAIQY